MILSDSMMILGENKKLKNEIDVVKDVSKKLQSASIDFMLTGSMAMNYYAQPRMTRDIDMVVNLKREDTGRVIEAFSKDYYVDESAVKESVAKQSMFNLIHNESVIKVDLIVKKDNEYRQLEFDRKIKIKIMDFTTFIVSKEDLILSKLLWAFDSHSSMQLSDVKNLVSGVYDEKYLSFWADKLKVGPLLKECLS